MCYTREFKNPKTDTFKAIFYSGLLCIAVFTLVPIAFQGHLGLGHMVAPAVVDATGAVTTAAVYDGMLAPDIYSGMGVAAALSQLLHGKFHREEEKSDETFEAEAIDSINEMTKSIDHK